MTGRARKLPPPLEGPIHSAILQRLRFELPGAVIHHSPNELAMKGPDAARLIRRAKDAGMVPGFPDFVVLTVCGQVAFLEVKRPKGRESAAQKELRIWAQGAGHRWAVVTSQDEAVAALRGWGLMPKRRGVV